MKAILGVLFLAACATACANTVGAARDDVDDLEVDSGTDAAPSSPAPDAHALPDARPATTLDAGHPDALPAQGEASPDGAAPSAPDAGSALPDGARALDAAAGDGSSGNASVDKANADIRRVFPQPCTPNTASCGTVDHTENGTTVILTDPLFCWGGTWGLAWNGNNVTYTCSHACGYGQLCAP